MKIFSFLFIILITFFSCSESQKIKWQEYSLGNFSMEVPENYIVSRTDEKIILIHQIPHEHTNECNYAENIFLYNLTDLSWEISYSSGNLINHFSSNDLDLLNKYVSSDNTMIIETGFIDAIEINGLSGYRISMQYDGCGYFLFVLISENDLLTIMQNNSELRTTSLIRNEWVKLPEIIQIEEEEQLLNHLLTTVEKIKSHNSE